MNIEELKRLAEAATPGPWKQGIPTIKFGTHNPATVYGEDGETSLAHIYGIPTNRDLEELAGDKRWKVGLANASYIAALSPERILAMIRAIESADAMRETLSEISGSKSLTATPTQFYQHLQRIAAKATGGPYDAARAELEKL